MSLNAREIDAHVGLRMRQRREALGISQGRLGRHLGLTFSQIQKYEKGSNRIGAGRLFQIASFLGVPTSYFFEGMDDEAMASSKRSAHVDTVSSDELRALSGAFAAIQEPGARASVLALVRSLSANAKNGEKSDDQALTREERRR